MKPHIYVVGMGPGSQELVTEKAKKVIEKAEILIGGRRHLELYQNSQKELYTITSSLSDALGFIEHNKGRVMAVLASGDPMLYGIGNIVMDRLPDWDITVIPGISAISYLASVTGVDLSEFIVASVHGKQVLSIPNLGQKKNMALLTGGSYTPNMVCKVLDQLEYDMDVIVGENLSYDNEKITRGTLKELKEKKFDGLSTMFLSMRENALPPFGVPDSQFIRENAPMTKEEIRAVSVAKLRLQEEHIIFDIGAGTGSVSIACARQVLSGTVYAIEKEPDRIGLVEKNRRHFGLHNIISVLGEAPVILDVLPKPDRVFIGGTQGKWLEIISWIGAQCKDIRVVANAITLQSAEACVRLLREYSFQNIECVQVWVAKSEAVGGLDLLKGQNPIFIISADRG